MKDEKSGQSAELNPDHGDKDPSFGTRLGGFVIADQSPLAHQPAEGAFHDPTGAPLKIGRLSPRPMSTLHCKILPLTGKQTTQPAIRKF
jgi:hypothetical protein